MSRETDKYSSQFKREVGVQPEWEGLPSVKLLRVNPGGEGAQLVTEPPKKRGIVVALGWKAQMTIAFPYGNAGADGYHDNSEAYINKTLGVNNVWTVMHGAVEKIGKGAEGRRTVFIYQMPDRDRQMIEGVCHDLSCRENGVVDPSHFLNGPNFVPQRILQALQASELRVVEGIASASLYRLTR